MIIFQKLFIQWITKFSKKNSKRSDFQIKEFIHLSVYYTSKVCSFSDIESKLSNFLKSFIEEILCKKLPKYGVFSGPYFSRTWTEYSKIQIRKKAPYLDTFLAVRGSKNFHSRATFISDVSEWHNLNVGPIFI